MAAQQSLRSKLIKELEIMLGGQMVDVELDPEHYNLAVDLAIERFRQRSQGSVEESYLFITLQPGKQVYTLPDEVQDVRALYRRGVGYNTTGGATFDPFEASFSNIYLLQSGRTGGLTTWDFFSQYQETVGRIFGSALNFTWSFPDRKLTVLRRATGEEDVAVHVYNQKPEIAILTDTYAKPWIRDYSLAKAKIMLGEARSRFTSGLPGPGGNVTLNGAELKAEGLADLERLEQEILNFTTSEAGMPFIIG